jgi:hypothetical protein
MIDIAGDIRAKTLTRDKMLFEADDFEDDTGKDETSHENQEGFN